MGVEMRELTLDRGLLLSQVLVEAPDRLQSRSKAG